VAHSHRSVRLDEIVARGLCRRGSDVPPALHAAEAAPWSFEECCGRVVEISSDGPRGAALTAAIGLLVQAQRTGEPVAWVSATEGTFFPPDADAAGVDLDALAVVRVPDAQAGGRAADKLMRSGAFGLVVLDLGEVGKGLTPALQGRLHGLAQRHGCALVCLTDKKADAPSLGAAVALRVAARRRRRDGRLVCAIEALKDRRRSAGWTHEEVVDGPPGLR
jgi:recombination protein RecA